MREAIAISGGQEAPRAVRPERRNIDHDVIVPHVGRESMAHDRAIKEGIGFPVEAA